MSCLGLLLLFVLVIAAWFGFESAMAYLAPLVTFWDVLEGMLGAMALLAGLAALCRYVLKRRDVSFKLALLHPALAAGVLLGSGLLNYFATEEYAKNYVGNGIHPGAALSLISALFLIGAVVILALGFKAALGSAPDSEDKGHFLRLGI
jgi:hypothetical protein